MLALFSYIINIVTIDTAFISSRGGWVYCDDSSVKPTDAREVVVSIVVCLDFSG